MLPMICPQCSYSRHRAAVTNGHADDQIVRKRVCEACCHAWFTVEVIVPSYAVGWSAAQQRKPVLRTPMELSADGTGFGERVIIPIQHEEAKDQLAPLREANARKSAAADARYGM